MDVLLFGEIIMSVSLVFADKAILLFFILLKGFRAKFITISNLESDNLEGFHKEKSGNLVAMVNPFLELKVFHGRVGDYLSLFSFLITF